MSATSPIPASVFVICRDAEETIALCLRSVADFDDIVVVDSGSTDRTLEVLKELESGGLPIRLFHRDWPGYAAQKQFALEQCRHDWCLSLDADEEIDEPMRKAIADLMASGPAQKGYDLLRREWIAGYGHAHRWVAHTRMLRFFDRRAGGFDLSQSVHESVSVSGPTGVLKQGFILHNAWMTPEQHAQKQIAYSSLKVQQRLERGKKALPIKMAFSPLEYFFRSYVLRRYFLCGWGGLAASLLDGSYAFQTEWKHWLAEREVAI
ncbi:glycosyltransferase family 2 protein [Nitratireductor basaltis]|uniref:Glycosyl transferase family 2 n=1 Tax=Nitratireductor basaltis TaxID=472175 RepID=A0A084UDH6_9HYPH|nr:glycosyltransferase family 2 protein [Nitratireductor basaltis]KFB11012.1 Glycosyl transferase family 2 [Nitratireductor basaltis]